MFLVLTLLRILFLLSMTMTSSRSELRRTFFSWMPNCTRTPRRSMGILNWTLLKSSWLLWRVILLGQAMDHSLLGLYALASFEVPHSLYWNY